MSLKTVELHQTPDADGIARLEIPVSEAGRSYRFIVLVEPDNSDGAKRSWSPGFFARTYGQRKGELERAPQGEPEKREEF
jgi:hypothetical protein